VEPCSSRRLGIENLNVGVDAIVFLHIVNYPAERFDHLAKQTLAGTVRIMLFRVGNHCRFFEGIISSFTPTTS
jgi:hypothetical protein